MAVKHPLRALAKAQRLALKGRPVSALLALQPATKAKKPRKPAAPRPKAKPSAPKRAARPQPGSVVQARFEDTAGAIDYRLYTPLGSARRRLPLVVMLHGCGQSASDFAAGTAMNRLADELGFLVLYPEQSRTANLGGCWNWHRRDNQQRGSGEPALIAALTRHAIALGRANPARVYVAGISAGAVAAAIVAAAYPELFVAVGAHSGLSATGITTIGQALTAMRRGGSGGDGSGTKPPPPTIVFHGDGDTVVHPSNAGGFLDTLRRSSGRPIVSRATRGRSAGGRDYTRTLHRFEGGPVMLEDWVIHGSGHAWSGGSRAGSHTDPAGPDASREMLRFFLACGKARGKARA